MPLKRSKKSIDAKNVAIGSWLKTSARQKVSCCYSAGRVVRWVSTTVAQSRSAPLVYVVPHFLANCFV